MTTRKVISLNDVSVDALLRRGMEALESIQRESQKKAQETYQKEGDMPLFSGFSGPPGGKRVRNMRLFHRLAIGEDFIKNLTPGTLDQCISQLQILPLEQLIRIRLVQPDMRDVPDSLMNHNRFMREIDQCIFRGVVDLAIVRGRIAKTEDDQLFHFFRFGHSTGGAGSAGFADKAKRRLGRETLIVLGLASRLQSENLAGSESWWRVIAEVPPSSATARCLKARNNCNVNKEDTRNCAAAFLDLEASGIASQSGTYRKYVMPRTEGMPPLPPRPTRKSAAPSTPPMSELELALDKRRQASGECPIIRRGRNANDDNIRGRKDGIMGRPAAEKVARGRRSLEAARSQSVEAVCRTLEKAGMSLVDTFVKIPEVLLTTVRPSGVSIYLYQSTDWTKCQTLPAGPSSALENALRLSCDIFEADSYAPLSQFLRPADATSAVRHELETRIKTISRSRTILPAAEQDQSSEDIQLETMPPPFHKRPFERIDLKDEPLPTPEELSRVARPAASLLLPGVGLIQGLLNFWRSKDFTVGLEYNKPKPSNESCALPTKFWKTEEQLKNVISKDSSTDAKDCLVSHTTTSSSSQDETVSRNDEKRGLPQIAAAHGASEPTTQQCSVQPRRQKVISGRQSPPLKPTDGKLASATPRLQAQRQLDALSGFSRHENFQSILPQAMCPLNEHPPCYTDGGLNSSRTNYQPYSEITRNKGACRSHHVPLSARLRRDIAPGCTRYQRPKLEYKPCCGVGLSKDGDASSINGSDKAPAGLTPRRLCGHVAVEPFLLTLPQSGGRKLSKPIDKDSLEDVNSVMPSSGGTRDPLRWAAGARHLVNTVFKVNPS